MPDQIVRFHNRCDFAASNHLDSGDAILSVNPPRYDIIFYGVNLHSFLTKTGEVFVRIGRVIDADVADDKRRALLPDDVVDSVSAQQEGKLPAGVDERAAEPKYRVVLLFQSRAIGRFYDVQTFHHPSPPKMA